MQRNKVNCSLFTDKCSGGNFLITVYPVYVFGRYHFISLRVFDTFFHLCNVQNCEVMGLFLQPKVLPCLFCF